MNDIITAEIGLIKRQLRDVLAVASNIDHRSRAQERSTIRPGIVSRIAACELIGRSQKRSRADIAAEHWPHDLELRAAINPARTDTAGWAAELVGVVIADIAGSLLGASVFSQLRALSAASYDLIDGKAIKAVAHSSVPSGGFVGEGQPISVGALLIGAVNLQAKKAASIVAVSREVLKGSAENVQTSLQQLLGEDLTLAVDQVLTDDIAADAIRPAGLRAGVAGLTPSAASTPAERVIADVGALLTAIQPASKPVLIAAAPQLVSLAAYLPGMPLIAAPLLASGTLIALDANAFANVVGVIDITSSGEPVLHMSDAAGAIAIPGVPNVISAPSSSMFQSAAVAMRCILDLNWAMRRAGATSWMSGVTW